MFPSSLFFFLFSFLSLKNKILYLFCRERASSSRAMQAGFCCVPQSPDLQLTLAGDKWTDHLLLNESVSWCCYFWTRVLPLSIRRDFSSPFSFFLNFLIPRISLILTFSTWEMQQQRKKKNNVEIRIGCFNVVHPSVQSGLESVGFLSSQWPSILASDCSFHLLRLHCWRDPLFRIPVGEEEKEEEKRSRRKGAKEYTHKIKELNIDGTNPVLATNEMNNMYTLLITPHPLSFSFSIFLFFCPVILVFLRLPPPFHIINRNVYMRYSFESVLQTASLYFYFFFHRFGGRGFSILDS